MGIVLKQSIQNTVSTYIGFVIGALNTLFLYIHFLTDEYYGLVGFLLSTATIMMPLMSFGMHNTLIKFYSSYTDKLQQTNFLTLCLYLPLLVIIPIGFMGYLGYDVIVRFLSKENPIIQDYVWSVYLIAIAMAYFEVFYAWVRVSMKSAFGNFMKEVFHRILISFLLFAVYLEWLSASQFIWSLVVVYFLRMFVIKLYAFRLHTPKITFKKPQNFSAIIKYSILIIFAGSVSLILLDIDKVMIGSYIPIENVAYYNVAVFIAMVIAVPSRSMAQIATPLTAQLINAKQWVQLKDLYQKSSLTLLVISGWIFLLIVLNVKQMYLLIDPVYSVGLQVVFIISIAKLAENILGNNNAIIINSDYYRWMIALGIFLAVTTIVLNMLLIPKYGIYGAAIATTFSLILYSALKISLVKIKFKMHPFTKGTYKTFLLIFVIYTTCFFWDFNMHPVVNIAIKSAVITVVYFSVILKWDLSIDVSNMIKNSYKRFFK